MRRWPSSSRAESLVAHFLMIFAAILVTILAAFFLLWPSAEGSGATVEEASSVCTYYMGFNVAKAPLDDVLVRRALVAALNRQGIPDIMSETAFPAMTFTPPGVVGHVDGFSQGVGLPYDVPQAQQWLADAGYPDGQGFPNLNVTFAEFDEGGGRNFVPYLARLDWQDNLGIDVGLAVLDQDIFMERLQTDPPALWYLRWCADHPLQVDAHYFLYDAVETYRLAHGNWTNSTYDDLLAQAVSTPDPAQRTALYTQAEEILVETDVVVLPLTYLGVVWPQYLPLASRGG